jgi:hypothetical protein
MAASKCSRSGSGAAPSWMVYVAFALVATLALALAYQFMVRPALSARTERFQGAERKLVYVYMNGCGWCQRFTPVWDSFAAKHGSVPGLRLLKVESSDPEAGAYRVEGYPTVLLDMGDGRHVLFGGERTEKGLLAFLADNGVSVDKKKEGFFAERLDSTPQYLKDSGAAVSTGGPSKERASNLSKNSGGVQK